MKSTIIVSVMFLFAAFARGTTARWDAIPGTGQVVVVESDQAALAAVANEAQRAQAAESILRTNIPPQRVMSVNGRTGDVTITAAELGALTSAPPQSVASVNSHTGAVVLAAGDVGADPAGAAAAATSGVPATVGSVMATTLPTSTVARAATASALEVAGGWTWTEQRSDGLWQVTVTNSQDVYVSGTNGDGYNGPPLGTVWTTPITEIDGTLWWADNGSGFTLDYEFPGSFSVSQGVIYWDGAPSLPGRLNPGPGSIGSMTLNYVPITNATKIATAIMLSDHNADPNAHPDIRTNAIDPVARAALASIPTNSVPGGWIAYDGGSNQWLRVGVSNWCWYVEAL